MGDFGEDSDDSDGEGGLGNVNRLIMRPPGHSGKAKRGHLCFDASFETGNLGRVDLVNEYEYDLFIRPDTCSPRLRFWFNFTVDNIKQDQRVIFNIVNISKERNLFMDCMTPIVKSSSRPKWQRIPKEHVFYHKSNVHQGHYVLSFSFGFDKEDDVFQFALAPPYSYSRLQTFLTVLEKKAGHLNENFGREILGSSVQKRRIDLITIGSLDKTKPKCKRRVVAIISRIHPGESPASFVCQGLLEFLVSSNSVASILREHVIFKIIPMMNPDGVFLGNYRSTVMGHDLNRSWHIVNTWCHPTLKAVIEMLTILDKNKEFQLDFVLDLHAHSSLKGCFIYGNTYEDVYRYERHILFPKLLATIADDCIPQNTMFNSDSNKVGTSRRYLCSLLSDKFLPTLILLAKMNNKIPLVGKHRIQKKKLWKDWFDCIKESFELQQNDEQSFRVEDIVLYGFNRISSGYKAFVRSIEKEKEVTVNVPEKVLRVKLEDMFTTLERNLDKYKSNIQYLYLKKCEHQLLKNYKELKICSKLMNNEVTRLLHLNIHSGILESYLKQSINTNPSILHHIFNKIENQWKFNLKSLLIKRKQLEEQMGTSGYDSTGFQSDKEYNMVCEKIRMEWAHLLEKVSLRCAVIYATNVAKSH